MYLWTCVDAETKLIPSFLVGKRSADNARRLMADLRDRLILPKPHATDAHAYQPAQQVTITEISTDGFVGYPEAVDLAFGPYVKYGVVIKECRSNAMAYSPSEMVGTNRPNVPGLKGNEGSICTSHVERNKLTIRTVMRRFSRLSLGFSKELECHEAACAMFVAYYDFVWRTRYPDNSGRPAKLRPTAAIMAGVVDRLSSFDKFYNEVIQYGWSMNDFAIAFPVRFVVLTSKADSLEFAEIYGINIGGTFCLAMFTDRDLLERHVRENALAGDSIRLVHDSSQLLGMVPVFQRAGFDGIVFDHGKTGTHAKFCFSFDEIENLLK